MFRELLHNQVPQQQINKRIENYFSKKDLTTLRRALGEKTFQETQELVYGRNPGEPSAESLMGQYLAETQAVFRKREYSAGPGKTGGQEKYGVSIKQSSFNIFIKYFGRVPELMFHDHTPSQGTLIILFNQKFITYAGADLYGLQDMEQQEGTLLPMIILSSSEANRLDNYFMLGSLNRDFAKTPWDKVPNYCARGGYISCTHWFGEMPVGDKKVTDYVYPGRVDRYAAGDVGKGPQRQVLQPYVGTPEYQNSLRTSSFGDLNESLLQLQGLAPPDRETKIRLLDLLTQQVWTVPGAQHFAEMLGQQRAKLRGEFANPGYVAYTLIGNVGMRRVPYVFQVISDNARTLPQELMIQAY